MVSFALTSQMCTAISTQSKMVLLWLMVARTMLALAPAELKILRTNMRTDVAIVELIQWLLMQCHKLDIIYLPWPVWHACVSHATIKAS